VDLEQLKYLTDDQKDKYLAYEKVFDQKGWGFILGWLQGQIQEQAVRAINASSWDDHRVATGARIAYEQLASLRESVEAEFIARAEENMLNAKEDDELEYE
jgi:diphthamide synthase subunit DPH2